MARSRAGFWHGPVIYWLDVGWYGLMVCATDGARSPFFSFFLFAILATSFRRGFEAGARLTLGAALVGYHLQLGQPRTVVPGTASRAFRTPATQWPQLMFSTCSSYMGDSLNGEGLL